MSNLFALKMVLNLHERECVSGRYAGNLVKKFAHIQRNVEMWVSEGADNYLPVYIIFGSPFNSDFHEMTNTAFFSWQSDTPAVVGRTFVESALEIAITNLNNRVDLVEADREESALTIDKDTKGVAGSPPIVETIFKKISEATAFIADLTFSGKRLNGHPTPNPNVLIEYGWALHSLGYNRVIGVMNKAYGDPKVDDMPFDMRHLRHPITYDLPAGATSDQKRSAKKELVADFVRALEPILSLKSDKAEIASEPYVPTASAQSLGRFRLPSQAIGQTETHFLRPPIAIKIPVGPVYWLRLFPANKQTKKWTLSEVRDAAFDQTGAVPFTIFGWGATGDVGHLRGEDGFGMFPEYGEGETARWLSYVFREGEIWGIDHATPNTDRTNIYLFEALWNEALSNYVHVLRKLGVHGPLKWEAGMEETEDQHLQTQALNGSMRPTRCVAARIRAAGQIDHDKEAPEALIPFFIEVFDLCGVTRSS